VRRPPPPALREFLGAYDPAIGKLFFATRKVVLDAAPRASELIYDAYNAVTVAYSFSARLKEAFCHVAAYRSYVNLGFNQGASLEDPEGLLVGSGARIRHVRIASPADLRANGLRALVAAAVEQGLVLAPEPAAKPQAIVKAVYARKRRPQRTE
jgi:hypothetical protein